MSCHNIIIISVHRQKNAEAIMGNDINRRTGSTQKINEDRLNLALSGADIGVWDWNIADDELYFAPGYYTIAGHEPFEFPATHEEWEKRVHPEDLKDSQDNIYKYLSGEHKNFKIEFRYKKKDGNYMWIQSTGKIVTRDSNGNPSRITGVHSDITQRKNIELELRRNERQLRQIMDLVPSMIFVKNTEGRFLMANQAMAGSLNMQVNEMVGKLHKDIHPDPEQVEDMLTDDRKALESGKKIFISEEPYTDGNGKLHWFQTIKVPCGEEEFGEPAIVGLGTDITERKETEEKLHSLIHELKESEERFKALHNASFGGITIHDKGLILECNQGLADITGYSRNELIGMDGLLLIAEKSRKLVMDNILSGYEKPYEAWGVRKNGEEYPIRLEARNIPYKGKQVRTVEFRDITEQKKADTELRHLRNYLSNIINSMPSILITVDAGGIITQWNSKAEETRGLTFNEVKGKPLLEAYPNLKDEMVRIKEAVQAKTIQVYRKQYIKEDGNITYKDITIFPLTDDDEEGAVIQIDDVTEKVKIEEMMIQSEKMLSVGGLAAGMAHEINNPLAGILQTAGVMAGRLGGDLKIPANIKAAEDSGTTIDAIRNFMEIRGIPRMLSTIVESGERVSRIVNNILDFSRKGNTIDSLHSIEQLLDKTLELASTDYDLKKKYDFKKILISKEYNSNDCRVPCEASKIQQVFLNILRNGAEAMEEEGEDQPGFRIYTGIDKEKEMLRIEIEDSGPGMDDETRKRIFEPFFTTKAVGIGTGLGLSVSYFIIKEIHGGEMEVESEPGKGAKFIIQLPLKLKES